MRFARVYAWLRELDPTPPPPRTRNLRRVEETVSSINSQRILSPADIRFLLIPENPEIFRECRRLPPAIPGQRPREKLTEEVN